MAVNDDRTHRAKNRCTFFGFPIIILASFIVCFSVYASPSEKSLPPNPFIDIDVCPFECCEYKDWTAADKIQLLDKPDGGKIVGYLEKGEIVKGMSSPAPLKQKQILTFLRQKLKQAIFFMFCIMMASDIGKFGFGEKLHLYMKV